ncbi:MAG: 3-isopropylmalate dehydratase small subunit [Acidobacteria bacterium]|nr:3-isopropylmalate dehydratase small subunit [Acidobacteriota bacterium]
MRIAGRALVMRGNDIDTDRIMPARFLRAVSFDGLEAHLFEDDRLALQRAGHEHPFDAERHRGATVLLVNKNFGCGSSREHAPQGIARWGVRAIVGESFSEIFFSNATALGLPCLTVSAEDVEVLMRGVEDAPATEVTVDLARQRVSAGTAEVAAAIPASAREAFLTGTWDATAMLTADFDVVRAAAARVPYIAGF